MTPAETCVVRALEYAQASSSYETFTHYCLQLDEANELLSEEEVWYVLSEMAQVRSELQRAVSDNYESVLHQPGSICNLQHIAIHLCCTAMFSSYSYADVWQRHILNVAMGKIWHRSLAGSLTFAKHRPIDQCTVFKSRPCCRACVSFMKMRSCTWM